MEALPLLAALAASLNFTSGPLSLLSRHAVTYVALAQQNSLKHYLKMQYADQTFRGYTTGICSTLALLLPYFAVMIVLALYGIHRYTMCYLYFKYRKNYNPNPPKHFDELPAGHGATADLQ